MTKKPENLAALPKWAQDKIATLERTVAERDALIARDRGKRPDSPVQVIDYSRPQGETFGLDPHDPIRIQLGAKRWSDGRPKHWVEVQRRSDDGNDRGRVEIRADGPMVVIHHSSNVFTVDVMDRLDPVEG